MSLSDYRLCDVCGGKAFYDARLNYEHFSESDEVPFRMAGQPQAWATFLDYLGDWAVLCTDCAKTHATRVVAVADAQVISAARDLLEALRRTLVLAEKWAEGVGRSHPDHDVIDEAMDVLKKAEGK